MPATPAGTALLGRAVEVRGSSDIYAEPVTLQIPLQRVPDEGYHDRIYVAVRLRDRWFPIAEKPELISVYAAFARSLGYGLPLPTEAGSAKQIVIFVHGLDSSPETWDPMVAGLQGSAAEGTVLLRLSYPVSAAAQGHGPRVRARRD